MSKVMVTGAGGYVGTQLVRDLVRSGHQVTAVVSFSFGKEPLIELIGNKQLTINKKTSEILIEIILKVLMQFAIQYAFQMILRGN